MPFVLQYRDPRRGLRVAACDPYAWQQRIYPGMSISEASAILPGIHAITHDPQEDLESLCELAQGAWQFSPLVALEPVDAFLWAGRFLHSPQGLVLDATGLDTVFGDYRSMLMAIVKWLFEQGYLAVAAIHETFGGAWALANYAARNDIASKLLHHRNGTYSCESLSELIFDGNSHDVHRQFDRLSVECLRIESETAAILNRLGIKKFAQLRSLPREGLASRLGTALIDRIGSIEKNKPEPIAYFQPSPEFQCEHALEIATTLRETVQEILRRLTMQLCTQLQHHGQGALQWLSRLQCRQSVSHVMTLGLYRPTADHDYLWPLIVNQLERQTGSHLREIQAISVQAILTGPLAWKQGELFELSQQRHRETFAKLVDSLSNRIGRTHVLAPQIQIDPQPEFACRWRPLTGVRNDGSPQATKRKLSRKSKAIAIDLSVKPNAAGPDPSDLFRRPIQLYNPPVAIELELEPTTRDLKKIRLKDKFHRVIQTIGPERIESGWWSGATHRRDYYRIETDNAEWWWIYRDFTAGQVVISKWYLHGIF